MEIQTTHWPVHGTVLLAQLWFSMLSLFLPSDYIRLFGRNVMWLLICKYKICSMEVTGLAVFWFSLWNILACCFICHAMLWIFRERGTETEHSCPALHNHTYRYGMSRPLTSRNCQSHCWGRFSAALGNTPVLQLWIDLPNLDLYPTCCISRGLGNIRKEKLTMPYLCGFTWIHALQAKTADTEPRPGARWFGEMGRAGFKRGGTHKHHRASRTLWHYHTFV